MEDKYLIIRFPDGREGAVLESAFGNPDLADNFKGARAIGYEDGSEWTGPTTPEGMARRAEREAEAEEAAPERTGRRGREEKD